MIERIIFFLDYPFDKRDYKRFGIETLRKNGFNVEVWDFVSLLHPASIDNINVKDPMQVDRSFSLKSEALSAIMRLKQEDMVILLIPYVWESLFIYKAISKVSVSYCVMATNPLPYSPKQKMSFYNRIKTMHISLKNILNFIFKYVPFRCVGVKSASIFLAGGAASTPLNYPVDDTTEKLLLHTFDYDLYLEQLNETIEVNKELGVFLDEYMPFHPIYVHSGLPVPETEETYYEGLCRFFRVLESKYASNILIAAHPRSHYDEHPDYFEGRRVVMGNTLELVAKSKFVVCHSSTSINFAVMFHKPVIFITSNKIDKSWYGPYIHSMANAFGKVPINVDSNIIVDFNKELEIDNAAYSEYKRRYIKVTESKDIPFWEIFSGHIIEHY